MQIHGKVLEDYYGSLNQLYDELNLSPSIIQYLKSKSGLMNNKRNMSIIHGDRHKKNAIINSSDELIFIDWELGCVGDIAYDIAFHLHQMAYTEEDEKYFLNQLRNRFKNSEGLFNDIELYRLFLLARSTLYHVYWTDLVYKTGNKDEIEKQLGHFMRRYNRLSNFKEFNIQTKSEEQLSKVFVRFMKNSMEDQR